MDESSAHKHDTIAVIGAGSWGTTLAAILSGKGHTVTLWTHEKELAEIINNEHLNTIYLPDCILPPDLRATSSLEEAASGARYLVCVVPTQHIRSVFGMHKPDMRDDAIIVSASKGIEIGTLFTPSLILNELFQRPVAALSGPSFAREVIARLPTAVTLAAEHKGTASRLQEIFNTEHFRVYTHDDLIGVEIGGALKNVIAIASGICDGLGLGHNARAALITRGLAEITRLGMCMNAKGETFAGLSGLGDLVLTCTSTLSRNYTVGYKLGKGQRLPEIAAQMNSVAEGVTTTRAAYELSQRHSIQMPITMEVYRTLYQGKDPGEAVMDLMTRSLKSEFYQ